jgi:hypothetical protein
MERVANQEWIKEMANGEWVRGGKGKGMDSALWLSKGKRNRRDAAASLPSRLGANVFVYAVARVHFVCRRNSRKSGW